MSELLASVLALGGEGGGGGRVTPSALMSSPWKRNVPDVRSAVWKQMRAFKVF